MIANLTASAKPPQRQALAGAANPETVIDRYAWAQTFNLRAFSIVVILSPAPDYAKARHIAPRIFVIFSANLRQVDIAMFYVIPSVKTGCLNRAHEFFCSLIKARVVQLWALAIFQQAGGYSTFTGGMGAT